jgi:glycosyltransferase involved in cell wall biosynthesis
MRASIIIASHNEGDVLSKTLESCIEAGLGPASEIIVADDASTDGSVEALSQQYPDIHYYWHESRQGASPTKALGAQNASGDVLVFLDGHCKPERGSLERLIQNVDKLDGRAVITPAIPALDVRSWTNNFGQVGHGYWIDLMTLESGWKSLEAIRPWSSGTGEFYESPAVIGCAMAVSRDLYHKLKGFDVGMRYWGIEDLDFGLKCWLMGHEILHDPESVIGHRFQSTFSNYSVPMEHLFANQLRMAYKNFSEDVWKEWLERFQERNCGALIAEDSQGLWAQTWRLFKDDRQNAEIERSYLLSNRAHGEFWYAEKFGLAWPVMAPAPPLGSGISLTAS